MSADGAGAHGLWEEDSDSDSDISKEMLNRSHKRKAAEAFLSSDDESDSDDEEEEEDASESDDDDEDNEEEEEDEDGSDLDDIEVDQVEEQQKDQCAICLMDFTEQEIGVPENCIHPFCLLCIQEWSNNVNTCPVDRKPYRKILVKAKVNGEVIREVTVEDRLAEKLREEQVVIPPTYCEVCHQCDREDRLLLCDGCDDGYHLECLTPPLTTVPDDEWLCPQCLPPSETEGESGASQHAANAFLLDGVTRRTRRAARRGSFIVDDDDDDDEDEEEDEEEEPMVLPVQTRQRRSSSRGGRGRGRVSSGRTTRSLDQPGTSQTGRARTVASRRQQSATRGRPRGSTSRGRSRTTRTTTKKKSPRKKRSASGGKKKKTTKRKYTRKGTKGRSRKKVKTERVKKRPHVHDRVLKQFGDSSVPGGSSSTELARYATRCPFPSRMEPTLSFSVFGNDLSLEYFSSGSEEDTPPQPVQTRSSAATNPDLIGGILDSLDTLHHAEAVDREGRLLKSGKAKEKRRRPRIDSSSSDDVDRFVHDNDDIFTADDESDGVQAKRHDESSSVSGSDLSNGSQEVSIVKPAPVPKPESSSSYRSETKREKPKKEDKSPSRFNPLSFKIPKKVKFQDEQPEKSSSVKEPGQSSANTVAEKVEDKEKCDKSKSQKGGILKDGGDDSSRNSQQKKNLDIIEKLRQKKLDIKEKVVRSSAEQTTSKNTSALKPKTLTPSSVQDKLGCRAADTPREKLLSSTSSAQRRQHANKPPETVTVKPTQTQSGYLLPSLLSSSKPSVSGVDFKTALARVSSADVSSCSVSGTSRGLQPVSVGGFGLSTVDKQTQNVNDSGRGNYTKMLSELTPNVRGSLTGFHKELNTLTGRPSSSRGHPSEGHQDTSPSRSLNNTNFVSPLRLSPLEARVNTPPVAIVAPSRHSTSPENEPSDKSVDTSTAKITSDVTAKRMQGIARLQLIEEASDAVKLALKPYYKHKEIDKEEYKHILKKSVDKIVESGQRPKTDGVKILVKKYVKRVKGMRQMTSRSVSQSSSRPCASAS